MTPERAASLDVLNEMYDALIELIRPLDDGCLNWTPPVPDANSIAALVTHTVGATDLWLARAVGEAIHRDRAAEFGVRAGAAALIELIERSRADARRRLELLDEMGAGVGRPVRRLFGPHAGQAHSVSAAWCVEHALIHAGEHWGQIQLTRQLYPARG